MVVERVLQKSHRNPTEFHNVQPHFLCLCCYLGVLKQNKTVDLAAKITKETGGEAAPEEGGWADAWGGEQGNCHGLIYPFCGQRNSI